MLSKTLLFFCETLCIKDYQSFKNIFFEQGKADLRVSADQKKNFKKILCHSLFFDIDLFIIRTSTTYITR